MLSHFGALGVFRKEEYGPVIEAKGVAHVPVDNGKPMCGKLTKGPTAKAVRG
jgi:hypothetical protein